MGALAVFVLLSCSKAPQKPSSPQPAAPASQPQAQGTPAAAGTQGQPQAAAAAAQTAPAASPAPAVVATPARIDTGIQSLFTLGRETAMLPEDFSIGPLSDPLHLEGRDKAAMAAARSFMSSLTDSRVDAGLLAPESSARLKDSLSYSLDKGEAPSSFRLGRPKELASGEIAFNVRLFRGEGAAEGEIFLLEKDKTWRVSDFQVNLSDLAEVRAKKGEKFFPSSYRWLLGE